MSPVVTRGLARRNTLEDPEQMRTLAEQAAEELADAPADEVIRWAVDTFGERICVTSSMTDAVIIHLASAVHPGIDEIARGDVARGQVLPGHDFFCDRLSRHAGSLAVVEDFGRPAAVRLNSISYMEYLQGRRGARVWRKRPVGALLTCT